MLKGGDTMDDRERFLNIENDIRRIAEKTTKLEANEEILRGLVMSIRDLTSEVKHMREEMGDINGRLKVVEKKPADKWENLMKTIISYVATAILAFLFAKFLK